jgi:GTPase SAR1 family protein
MIRLLIVGETGVGKTSILVRFNEGKYYSDQKTTIGVDYKAKEIDIDGETVKLQVYNAQFLAISGPFSHRLLSANS